MTDPERLITLVNDSTEPIEDMWDAVAYRFAPAEPVTLAYGAGLHFRTKHPSLRIVEESVGLAPRTIRNEVRLVLEDDEPLDLSWDGVTYRFEPQESQPFDVELAKTLVEHSRRVLTAKKSPGRLVIVAVAAEEPQEDNVPPKPVKKAKKAKSESQDKQEG